MQVFLSEFKEEDSMGKYFAWILIIIEICLSPIVFGIDQQGETQGQKPFAVLPSETVIKSIDEVNSSMLLFLIEKGAYYVKAPDLSMSVEMEVSGIVSKTKFAQEFSNPHDQWLEAIYVFPLPETASVNKLRLVIRDRIIEGTIMEKAEAKKVYEAAKENGEQAALLEEERPNMFVTSVANIPPHEKVAIELEYIETVGYDNGAYSLRFPLVITPRYNPGESKTRSEELGKALDVLSKSGGSSSSDHKGVVHAFNKPIAPSPMLIQPILEPGKGLRNPVDIRIKLVTGFSLETIASLYHSVNVSKPDDSGYSITLANGPVPADRDFVMVWKPAPRGLSDVSVLIEEKKNVYYSLAMIIPPKEKYAVSKSRRELIFIFDHSGSMFGASLDQAKAALTESMTRLAPDDTFNLIAYNDSTSSLFPECIRATEANKKKALDFVARLQADGGTEMKPALDLALSLIHIPAMLRQVLFITDGAVSNEAELLSLVRDRLGEGRLFTVGIGSAPNSFFMRKAAEIGRGSSTFIGNAEEVKMKMSDLFEKIENPVLRDIRIAFSDNASDSAPEKIPDLYSGEPVVILSKLAHPGGVLHCSGTYYESGTGKAKLFTKDIDLSAALRGSGIASLWASKKIESLLDKAYEGESEERIKPAVLALSLDHQVMSPFTSLVAIEKRSVRPGNEKLETSEVPLNPPHGFDIMSGDAGIGKAGLLTDLAIWGGVFALIIAGFFLVIYRRTHEKKYTNA
jgi:Ca-activated chloride channel homolog